MRNVPHRGRHTCGQCLLETEAFSDYQPRGAHATRPRRLNDMLALPLEQRREHSFLCQAEGHYYGPLALAVVDPKVVALDLSHAPPDRFHGIVDMINDLLGVVRQGLKERKLARVCLRTGLATSTSRAHWCRCSILVQGTLAAPSIWLAYARHMPHRC